MENLLELLLLAGLLVFVRKRYGDLFFLRRGSKHVGEGRPGAAAIRIGLSIGNAAEHSAQSKYRNIHVCKSEIRNLKLPLKFYD